MSLGPAHPAPDDLVVGVARDVEHLEVRPLGRQALDQLPAADLRHHHVSDEQVDGALVALRQHQRVPAMAGLEDGVAVVLEALLREVG